MADWPYSTEAWQRLRKAKLSGSPLCEVCKRRGKLTVATCVDHILAIADGGKAFPSFDELMSMCQSCHSVKTNNRIAFKGCGLDGLPVDPDHPSLQGYTPSKDESESDPDRAKGGK